MSAAFEAGKVGDQEFSSPNLAIGAVSGAIEGNADHLSFEVILRHATRDVCMVVLHAYLVLDQQFLREASTHVAWVKVVSNSCWFHAKELLQVVQCFLKEGERLVILKVTNVLAEKSKAILRQAESVLQFCTAGENFL